MGLLFAQSFGRDIKDVEKNKDVYYICALTEIIHNGTLMIDDVQDMSELRRGEPCTHKKFGIDIATNTGSFMYYAPMIKLNKYIPKMKVSSKISSIYHEEMFHILLGQNWDINWHRGVAKPTEA